MASADDEATLPYPKPFDPGNGTDVLHYEIEQKIGAGGMGQVYRARDKKLGRRVALKFLSGELAGNQDALRRFEREAKTTSAIAHPNVVTVYAIEHFGDLPFIVYRYVEGDSLAAFGREPLETRLRLLGEIAQGLAAVHAAGVVHRDMKPSNIIVSSYGVPVIVDFGLGKFVAATPEQSTQEVITQDQAALGTIYYMAPEQLRGESVGFAADVFAYGVLAFELLTGKRPFDRANKPATVAAILHEPPYELRERAPEVPAAVAALLQPCLEKDSNARPTSSEIATAMAGAALATKGSLPAPNPLPVRSERVIPSSLRQWVETWHDEQMHRAWSERPELAKQPTIEFKFVVDRDPDAIQQISTLYKLLDKIEVLTDVSLVGRLASTDNQRAHRGSDYIFAVPALTSAGRLTYWAARRTGDLYSISILPTRDDGGQRRIAIESLLGEWIATLHYYKRFASVLRLDPATGIKVIATLRHAKDIALYGFNSNRAFTYHLGGLGKVASTDEAESQTSFVIDDLAETFGDIVPELFDDLIAYFDFVSVPTDFYDFAITTFRKSHE